MYYQKSINNNIFKLNYTEISFNKKKIKYQQKILFFWLDISLCEWTKFTYNYEEYLYQKNGINAGFKYFGYGKLNYKAFMLKFWLIQLELGSLNKY